MLSNFGDSTVLGFHCRLRIPHSVEPTLKRLFAAYTDQDCQPGVQDSNAARAAVAANYMKSCTGLWIVAPINRAVDDKTAKSLLGDSFKRQLQYDGTYSAVSFICSKTDDISITEAAESLGLEAEISESWDSAEDLRKTKRSLQSKISDLKEAKATLGEQLDECEAKTDLWEDLQSQVSSGKTVYAPSANFKKRKRTGRPSKSRKNLDSSDVDDDWDASDSGSSDKENSQAEEICKTLTEEDVEEQVSSLRAQRKNIRGERRSLDSQIAELRKEIEQAEQEREGILADLIAIFREVLSSKTLQWASKSKSPFSSAILTWYHVLCKRDYCLFSRDFRSWGVFIALLYSMCGVKGIIFLHSCTECFLDTSPT
jgi:prefoldin subunit 5